MKLADISNQLNCECRGDGSIEVKQFCSIERPKPNSICYIREKKYFSLIKDNKDIAVLIVTPEMLNNEDKGNFLITDNPYFAYSELSKLLSPDLQHYHGIHPTAHISQDVKLGSNISIGANTIIEDNVIIGDNCVLQAGCFIGKGCVLGEGVFLFPNVTINYNSILGDFIRIQSGVVIGSEGFGYAKSDKGWNRIAQSGRVVIGNKVEIGANTTIDRGAIDDTVIEDGVILDNQIQIAHNVHIGKNTAMAGCVGVAGSAIIGKNCTVGGAAVILGHLQITDNVHITAMSLVTKSINKAGQYSSGGMLESSSSWRKNAIRFKQLDKLFKKIRNL